MDQTKSVEFSVVTTMYRSAEFISEFYNLSTKAASGLSSSYEIIFVNDGSPDDSLKRAMALVDSDSHVRVIDLSRNFGHHRAIMVGLEHARGKKVFLIDCDLEEDPMALSGFNLEMENTKAEVVFGVQENRKGNLVKNLGGSWFWSFFNVISDVTVTPNMITSRIMSRRYIDALLKFREKELFLAGIFAMAGFLQVPMTVKKGVRSGTTYTFRKRFSLLVNAITSFSSRPLVLVFYFGLAISIVAGIAGLFLVARTFIYGDYLIGWPSVMVSIWLIAGITIFCIGLIGIYLAKVFQEVKDRPLSIVRNIYERI